ncbi:sulfurtransferase [Kordia sp. SMS9]|uniref:sulfurtransferase n=1 Tax=Kordia sp. SMS9 TaxID=2282170 RepID=UPI000E0CE5EC|nr:sulfurtransferase [Kordia sp. SMS9]
MHIQLKNSIVSVDWLQEHVHATNLIVLNGTIPKVVGDTAQQETQQIPNARFFDIKKVFSVLNAPFPNTMISVEAFTEKAQKLGINQDSAIVVYDELGMYAAPRVWYMFKSMGFDNIAVLDGGFPAWRAAKYPVEAKIPFEGKRGDFQGKDQLYLFKNYPEMLQTVANDATIILDARSEARFTGNVPEPRAGLRSGTIPTSKNLPYTEVLHKNSFKSKEELQTIFSAFNTKKTPFTFTCGSGITACILALAADIADYTSYYVYDGSWTEWGSVHR